MERAEVQQSRKAKVVPPPHDQVSIDMKVSVVLLWCLDQKREEDITK
jgi:hypothetical protein